MVPSRHALPLCAATLLTLIVGLLGPRVASGARELPPRIVVLDERSPHLELVAAVREAFAEELDALSAPSAGLAESGAADPGRTKEESPEGILRALVEEVIAGNLDVQAASTSTTATVANAVGPYNTDPLTTAVAAELDLEAGVFTPGYEGTVLATGQIIPIGGGGLAILPPELREGYCAMPTLAMFPSVTDATGRQVRRPRTYWRLDTALCQYAMPTKREVRKAKLHRRNLEERALRSGSATSFSGVESLDHESPSTPTGLATARSTFSGCAPHYIACGHGNTNKRAVLKSRVYGATGAIATNAVAQTYWFWDGQRSRCANVGGYMYDFVLLDGPGDLDVKWEPRNCSPNRGEYCQGSCPLQWLASTQAPNSAFKFWAVTVGFHRFHYFIPAGTPIPGGVQHDFYHFDRAEYLVEPTRAFFTGISCYAGGNYGRGFPWYQYHGCVADAG